MDWVQIVQLSVSVAVSLVIPVTSLVFSYKVSKNANNLTLQSIAYEAKRKAYAEFMSATYGIIDTEDGWKAAATATYGLMLYTPDAISEKANRLLMLMNDACGRLKEVQNDSKEPRDDVVYMDYCAEFSHLAMGLMRLLKDDISPRL